MLPSIAKSLTDRERPDRIEIVQRTSSASVGQPAKSRIIGLAEVMQRTNYSKSKIYRDIRFGKFPAQAIKLAGSTSAGWFEDEIDEFLEARRRESSHRGNRPQPKASRQRDVETADIHCPDRPNPNPRTVPYALEAKLAEDQTLVRTGMRLNGADVFCHKATRKLLVVVGSISHECLASLEIFAGPISIGANRGGNGANHED